MEHFEVTVGVSERRDGPLGYELMDAYGLAIAVINQVNRSQRIGWDWQM